MDRIETLLMMKGELKMIINQYNEGEKKGDGWIEFEEHEIKIIKEKGRLEFNSNQIKQFADCLMELSVRIFSQTEKK